MWLHLYEDILFDKLPSVQKTKEKNSVFIPMGIILDKRMPTSLAM